MTGHRADLVGGGLKRNMARMDSDEKEWGNFDERILGSGDFVDSLQQNETLRGRLPVSMALPDLILRVSVAFNLQSEAIIRHGKGTTDLGGAWACGIFSSIRTRSKRS